MSATSFCPDDFKLQGDADHLRVDGLCRELLMTFYHDLVASGVAAGEATSLASSADYFVRDFLVDNRLSSPFAITPELVRQFAATWYIISTVEPNRDELVGHLAGINAFCRYLVEKGYLMPEQLPALAQECARIDYFTARIEAFWQLSHDGYQAWEAECTLK